MTFGDQATEIAPRTGTAFTLAKGQRLTVMDPEGGQVGDLVAFNAHDRDEVLSNGRTLDYAGRLYLTTGDPLYSNRSSVMLTIAADTCGRHDFLLTPCSRDTFRILYGEQHKDAAHVLLRGEGPDGGQEWHPGCFGNLAQALAPHSVPADRIPCAFNCFMNVPVDGATGELKVLPPLSKAGDHVDFVAEMDLLVGLTACSAPQSNGGSFKPIHYKISSG